MTRGLNKVMIVGNLGRDPEMRYTPSGRPVTSFSMACSRGWVTSDGERREDTEWFNVVAWGDLAEGCNQLLRKGSRVYVSGRLQTRGWDDQEGHKHYRTELVASELIPLNDRGDGALSFAQEAPSQDELDSDEIVNSLNQVMLIGRLGRDPEMRYTASGKPVTSFSIATRRRWLDSEGGRRDETEWFNVVAWGNLAEICRQYLGKDHRVYVEGRMQTRSWEDSSGQRHYRTEVVANEMLILDGRSTTPSENAAQATGFAAEESLL